MFTGLVKELGRVEEIAIGRDAGKLKVFAKETYPSVSEGDSVAVNGACLTVKGKDKGALFFDIMAETLRATALSSVKKGDKVNLEPALKAADPLGGHFVLGHVDYVGRIRRINQGKEFFMEIELPGRLAAFVVEKGSVAIDGVSLTVGVVSGDSFRVYMIPHTLKATNLGFKKEQDSVNVELDIIGKYVARFKCDRPSGVITEKFLKDKGF